jgi:hypothetical protein
MLSFRELILRFLWGMMVVVLTNGSASFVATISRHGTCSFYWRALSDYRRSAITALPQLGCCHGFKPAVQIFKTSEA